jgi:hypothetical protein
MRHTALSVRSINSKLATLRPFLQNGTEAIACNCGALAPTLLHRGGKIAIAIQYT